MGREGFMELHGVNTKLLQALKALCEDLILLNLLWKMP